MSEIIFNAVRTFQDCVYQLSQSGRFFFLILLAVIPGLCFTSITMHTIKIRARDIFRCKIEKLENGRWSWEEIQKFSEFGIFNDMQCYIKDYDYGKFVNVTFKEAKKIVDNSYTKVGRKKCTNFVTKMSGEYFPKTYPNEFADYCESLEHEIFYNFGVNISYILSCLLVVPLADILGRKRIFSLGVSLAYIAVFAKYLRMDFNRQIIGDILMHFAYPPLKYTTQALIFELSEDKLRPLAFILSFTGRYVPFIVFPFLPPMNWRCISLIAYSLVLLLPLPEWYIPDSPLLYITKKQYLCARMLARSLNDPVEHNELLVRLKNKVICRNDLKLLFEELRKINRKSSVVLFFIVLCVGFLSFYFNARTKLLYVYHETFWMTVLNCWSGLIAVVLVLPSAYLINPKFLMAIMFFINGILYCLLTKFHYSASRPNDVIELSITIHQVAAPMSMVFFEFYINEYFPTSHRCTCTGIYGASMRLGLLIFICIQQINVVLSQAVAAGVCLIGCILCTFLVDLKKLTPLVLQFEDIKLKQEEVFW